MGVVAAARVGVGIHPGRPRGQHVARGLVRDWWQFLARPDEQPGLPGEPVADGDVDGVLRGAHGLERQLRPASPGDLHRAIDGELHVLDCERRRLGVVPEHGRLALEPSADRAGQWLDALARLGAKRGAEERGHPARGREDVLRRGPPEGGWRRRQPRRAVAASGWQGRGAHPPRPIHRVGAKPATAPGFTPTQARDRGGGRHGDVSGRLRQPRPDAGDLASEWQPPSGSGRQDPRGGSRHPGGQRRRVLRPADQRAGHRCVRQRHPDGHRRHHSPDLGLGHVHGREDRRARVQRARSSPGRGGFRQLQLGAHAGRHRSLATGQWPQPPPSRDRRPDLWHDLRPDRQQRPGPRADAQRGRPQHGRHAHHGRHPPVPDRSRGLQFRRRPGPSGGLRHALHGRRLRGPCCHDRGGLQPLS